MNTGTRKILQEDAPPITERPRLKTVLLASLHAWLHHRGTSKGAALAFYTLFAMTPILVLAIAVAGYFFGADTAQGELIAQLRQTVGPNGAQAVQALLSATRNPGSGVLAPLLAAVLLLIGATSVFVELKESLDEMWGIPPHRQAAFPLLLRSRLLAFGLVLLLSFLLLVSIVCGAAFALLARLAGGNWSSSALIFSLCSSSLSFGIVASLFAVIYKMLPEAVLSWKDSWIGAVVTAGLFEIGKYAISLYLGNSGVASSFGAAGSLIALLLWVYYSAQIFFLGAAFTWQYALSCRRLNSAKMGEET